MPYSVLQYTVVSNFTYRSRRRFQGGRLCCEYVVLEEDRVKNTTRLLLVSGLLCLLVFLAYLFLFSGQEAPEPLDGDPLRERGMRAAAIGGELVSVAKKQLGALQEEHRADVGELLGELERKTAAVKELLSRKDADEEDLAAAVSALEKTLDGVLVVPDNETGNEERRTDS